jgi:hypothetical protein
VRRTKQKPRPNSDPLRSLSTSLPRKMIPATQKRAGTFPAPIGGNRIHGPFFHLYWIPGFRLDFFRVLSPGIPVLPPELSQFDRLHLSQLVSAAADHAPERSSGRGPRGDTERGECSRECSRGRSNLARHPRALTDRQRNAIGSLTIAKIGEPHQQ